MTEPWRYACPEGHRTGRRLTGTDCIRDTAHSDGYRCNTCEEHYPGDPIDLQA